MNETTSTLKNGKQEEYETHEVALREGDALFYLTEEPPFSQLFLNRSDSWPAFVAQVLVYVLHNQYAFEQCVNEYIKNMSFEEKMNFKHILTDKKYAH